MRQQHWVVEIFEELFSQSYPVNTLINGKYMIVSIIPKSLDEALREYIEYVGRKYGKRTPVVDCEPVTGYTKYAHSKGNVIGAGLESRVESRVEGEFIEDIKDWLAFLENNSVPAEVETFSASGGCFINNIINKKYLKLVNNYSIVKSVIIDLNNKILQQKERVAELLEAFKRYLYTMYNEVYNAVENDNRKAIFYGTKREEAGTGIRSISGTTLGSLVGSASKEELEKYIYDSALLMAVAVDAMKKWLEGGDAGIVNTIHIVSNIYSGVYGVRSDVDRDNIIHNGMKESYRTETLTREINVVSPSSAFANGNISENVKERRREVYRTLSKMVNAMLYPPDIMPVTEIVKIKAVYPRYWVFNGTLISMDLGGSREGVSLGADITFFHAISFVYEDLYGSRTAVYIGNPSGFPLTQMLYTIYNLAIYANYCITSGLILGDDAHINFCSNKEAERWYNENRDFVKIKGIYIDEAAKRVITHILGTMYDMKEGREPIAYKIPKLIKSETTPKESTGMISTWKRNVGTTFNIEQVNNEQTVKAFKEQYPMIRIVFYSRNLDEIKLVESNPSLYAEAYKVTNSTGDLIASMRSTSND
ncbi:MAG: hypothetical protein [aquatic viral metagenome]